MHLHLTGFQIVGGDSDHAFGQVQVIGTAVDVHQRNAGLDRRFGDFSGGGGIHRVDYNGVDLLTDEAFYLAQLPDHVAARVFELQLDAIGIGFGFCVHGFAQVGQPGVIELRHADADLHVSECSAAGENQGQGE
ncbi:hypothetical protein D3C80_1622370 [compost metagenome]